MAVTFQQWLYNISDYCCKTVKSYWHEIRHENVSYVEWRNLMFELPFLSISLCSHTWLQGFSCGQTNSNRKGRWINHVCQKHLEPNRKKVIGLLHTGNYSSWHQSQDAVHLKLVLIYRNSRITAADDDEFYTMLEEILLSRHEFVIMGDSSKHRLDTAEITSRTQQQTDAITCR